MAIVAAAQFDLKSLKAWHNSNLAGASTSAELEAIYKSDMESLKEAKSIETTACEGGKSTDCTDATAWLLMHEEFVSTDITTIDIFLFFKKAYADLKPATSATVSGENNKTNSTAADNNLKGFETAEKNAKASIKSLKAKVAKNCQTSI